MSKPKTPTTPIPQIEEITLADLVIDPSLSGRTSAEIKTNAKALAPSMTPPKGWDATQPGAYFERDGKKHLARGFTRTAAAVMEGVKTGYLVRIPDEPDKLRTEPIRSNKGKPISPHEQGRIYAAMQKGSDPAELKAGEVALEPMTIQAIADEVGYTTTHVSNCIAIFESPPAVGEMLMEGKVSSKIVHLAARLAKKKDSEDVDEGRQLRILKAAYQNALDDGKECATEKHFNAIKPDFMPKLQADTGKGAKKKSAPTSSGNAAPPDDEDEETGGQDEEASEAGDTGVQQSAFDLGAPAEEPEPHKPLSKKEATAIAKQLKDILTEAAGLPDVAWTLTEDEADIIIKHFISRGVTVIQSPV